MGRAFLEELNAGRGLHHPIPDDWHLWDLMSLDGESLAFVDLDDEIPTAEDESEAWLTEHWEELQQRSAEFSDLARADDYTHVTPERVLQAMLKKRLCVVPDDDDIASGIRYDIGRRKNFAG
jgi:negative regulator of sigma E activity